jgi:hypothetical protein
MVGATPAAAAAIVNGCCTLMATNPTDTAKIQRHHMLNKYLSQKRKKFDPFVASRTESEM